VAVSRRSPLAAQLLELAEHCEAGQQPVVVTLRPEDEQTEEPGDALAQPGVVVTEQVDVGVVGRPGDRPGGVADGEAPRRDLGH